jgi:hypothetical protein
MPMDRRQYLAITACSVVPGIAGCSGDVTPSEMNTDDESDSSDGSSDGDNSDQNSDSDSSESENGDGNSSDADHTQTLIRNTNRIISELEWFENGYNDAIYEHRNAIHRVPTKLEPLIESLKEDESVTQEQMDGLISVADEVAKNSHEVLEPHFTDHYNYWGVNRAELDKAVKYFERRDLDVVQTHLQNALDMYTGANTSTAVSDRYPEDPVTNRLFNWFRSGSNGNRMYEVTLRGPSVRGHSEQINKYVAGAKADISFDPMDENTQEEFDETFDAFFEPTDRQLMLKCKVHSVGSVSDSSSINSRETNSMLVFCQGYTDSDTAKAAYDLIVENKTVEGTETWVDGGVGWDRVYYQGEDDTIYADMLQAGRYLYVVNPTSQSWERRGGNWYGLLSNSWISP